MLSLDSSSQPQINFNAASTTNAIAFASVIAIAFITAIPVNSIFILYDNKYQPL